MEPTGARSSPARPLSIWVVSDGRTGIENQSLGLAEAIARLTPAVISRHHVRWKPAFDRLPSNLKQVWMLDQGRALLNGPDFPDIWIATGRASLPLSVRIKAASKGRTLVVQTQDPRWKYSAYDMIIAPAHDGVRGDNVFEIIGSPHRITPQGLSQAAPAFAARIEPLPHPRLAIMIGGRSSAFDLTADHAASLADQIRHLIMTTGGSLLMTFSRRTPDDARAIMTDRLSDLPGWIWDNQGDNPLFGFLHYGDHILVTEDSANMVTEAASTGKPVHILPMVPLKPQAKFRHLRDSLISRGSARLFEGRLDTWSYSPLAETERAAHAILQGFNRLEARH